MLRQLTLTHLDVVGSTSDHLRDSLRQDDDLPEGSAVRADVQTKGRGRQGRDWQSPAGNLYLSILLRPERPSQDWPSLALVAGLALRDAIISFRNPEKVRLKWPNDVLYDGAKSGGLLLEAVDGAVVLGCGVNLDTAPTSVEGWPAGCLNDGKAKTISADMLTETFAPCLIDRYNQWNQDGFAPQRQDWEDAAAHLGQWLELNLGGESNVAKGEFIGLKDDGRLCLKGGDGLSHQIAAGDVMRVRLASGHP